MLSRGVLFTVALCASHFTAAAGNEARHWVKTCEDTECVTFFERLDGDTASVIVSAGIHQQVGSEKMRFALIINPNVTQHQGAQAAVYSKRQWARQERQQRVNDSELKPFKLKFASCDENGCRAEIDATPQLILSMKKGEA